MKRQSILCVSVLTLLVAAATGGQRSVAQHYVTLGDWDFVPRLDGGRVESFVVLLDPALAVGDNITAVWFRRTDDASWQSFAWSGASNLEAIAHVKATLGLPDSTDALWPDADAQQGVDTELAVAPDAFAKGVFADDAFAPVIQSSPEPGPIIGGLAGVGYPAAALPIQMSPTNCTQNQVLTTLAAMVEADIGTGANGTLMAAFEVPYADCDYWRSLAATLDDLGTWTMPDLSEFTAETTGVPVADAWQSVPSDMTFGGPQAVIVDIGGLDGNGNPVSAAKLVIALEDVTPPMLEVELLGDGQPPMVSPGGLDYFLAPVTISAESTAFDNVDSVITNSVVPVDGSVGCEGPGPVVIASAGYYIYEATATDAAGNTAYYTRLFEVRDRYNYEATAAIESWTVTSGAPTDLVEAMLLLTSDMFEVEDINLATVAVWLADSGGESIGGGPLRLASVYVDNGAYDPDLVDLDAGIWRVTVQGEVPAGAMAQSGLRFSVTGSGLHGTPDAFDFVVGRRPLVARLDADAVLRTEAPPLSMADDPPPPPAIPPCRWKDELVLDKPDDYVHMWFGVYGSSLITVEATGRHIWGTANAYDNMCWFTSNAAETGSVASGATYSVFLEGANCCPDCSIAIVARPRFKAQVEINPPASAVAGGLISIATPCGDTQAAGGVGLGDFETETVEVTIGDYTFPIMIDDAVQALSQPFQGNLSCTVDACRVDVSIATGAYLSVTAGATILNLYAGAIAKIRDSKLGLTVTPTAAQGCVVENDGQSFSPEACEAPGAGGGGW